MRISRQTTFAGLVLLLITSLFVLMPARAGERLLSVNSGAASEVFFITGEPTLVMNGFDLTPLDILRPATIDRVTLSVDTPVPGAPVEVVIYEDANGGSPVDARLIGRQGANITAPGSVTIILDTPVLVNEPVVWVGFYLPVDFRFYGDQSGSSVLTYWAWSPGGTVDLNNLSSAGVIGPANGSAPVNLDMGGKARITAEITSANPLLGTPVILANRQTTGAADVDFSVMLAYRNCGAVQYDTADENISYESDLDVYCYELPSWHAPASPRNFERKGPVYDLVFFSDRGVKASVLPIFVTHCIDPDDADVDRALIGVAYESPRVWRILPTQRFGNVICAEVPHGGNLSYFVPTS